MKLEQYTLTVFSEDKPGLLSRVVNIITRRHINIQSVSSSPSSIEGIHKITLMVKVDSETIRKLCAQIDKQVDVLKAFYYENHELVYQEVGMYKIPTKSFYGGDKLETIMRKYNARILSVEEEYIVVEKVGLENEINALLSEFKKFGIYEFSRSGRVVIVKPMERLNTYLKKLEETNGIAR